MQMKKLPRKNSSREESFSQATSTLFFFHLQLHYAYRNIVTNRMDCCNSAVSALKGQLFFCSMKHMKREKGQLFLWSRYLENSSSVGRLEFADRMAYSQISRAAFLPSLNPCDVSSSVFFITMANFLKNQCALHLFYLCHSPKALLNREWQLFLHPSPFFGTRLKELAQYRTPIQENRCL